MSAEDSNSIRSPLNEALAAELSHLIGRVLDAEPTESERARLNEVLAGDEAARSYYLKCIWLHSTLMTTAGNQARHDGEELKRRLKSSDNLWSKALEAATPASVRAHVPRRTTVSPRRYYPAVAAAILFVALPAITYFAGKWFLYDSRAPDRSVADSARVPDRVAIADSAATTERVESTKSVRKETSGKNVARVSYVSRTARWWHPNDSYAVDSSVRAGNTLLLQRGEIELVYDSGVKLMLFGPAEFLVDDIGGQSRRGGLVASVPEAGHGFTIETPNGKVIDLGTEFGVVVDDFGVSEVSVFEGKVEAFPAGLADARTKKIELTKGRALQWSSDTLVSMDADRKRFASSLTTIPPSASGGTTIPASLDNGFRESAVDAQKWIALGDVQASSQGLVMKGEPAKSRQPYLVSTAEFDPANGPITVVCDIRFPQLEAGDEPSFAILTRSAEKRSDIDAPWNDTLATCVRCNYRSSEDSLDGTLETSTKYEPDRELTNMSWGGFQRPRSDVAYRLVMRDDGVNVSFTVSPVDDPSVNKTVTCRSLFRGYQNRIALEGWNDGVTVVDRVKVFQDPPLDTMASFSEPDRSPHASGAKLLSANRENRLAGLVPNDARLVFADRFDGEQIDASRWETLGDVVLDDGHISLGQPIEDAHINTWNPRPYLITRQQFTPSEGKLFILGRIVFDENFLQGYGGSFAVMTRSENHYGSGPGWEYSILRRGVRSNFWPAASGHDHNLEIHEKPDPSTIALLGGARLEITPLARSYFFCVEDDGQAARITIQDADDPSIRKTLSHPTTLAAPQSGFVGFESCWGSPVLLDDVQVFLSKQDPSPKAEE